MTTADDSTFDQQLADMSEEAIRLGMEGNPYLRADLVDGMLDLIRRNSHPAKPRPCEVCRKVTALVQRPFWCIRVALEDAR